MTLAAITKLLDEHETLQRVKRTRRELPNADWKGRRPELADTLPLALTRLAWDLVARAVPGPRQGKQANTAAKSLAGHERAYPGSISRDLPDEGRAGLFTFRDRVLDHLESDAATSDERNTLRRVHALARMKRVAPWVP